MKWATCPLTCSRSCLRFLQEGEIQPLGEQRPVKVDVRIIAATNTDLESMVADGRFREDLYYRLNVIRLRVPPLRERRSEVPSIVNYYLVHYSSRFKNATSKSRRRRLTCSWSATGPATSANSATSYNAPSPAPKTAPSSPPTNFA